MAQPATEEKKVQEISEKLQDTVENVLKGDALEEAFAGFIVKDNQMKKACCWEILKPHWNTIPQDYHEAALKQYVKCVYDRAGSSKRVQLLFDMLEELVKHSLVSPKVVCECLLLCEGLTWKKEDLWCQTMHLIRRIIGGVDYKGVRDLLRIILERTATIPSCENVNTLKVVSSAIKVVGYILDRNACLLPSYFAVNEVTKLGTDGQLWPHWMVGNMLADFVQSFRGAAQMVTVSVSFVSGRSDLLPVVGHSSSTANVWKLNPHTLRFTLTGPLPYDKEFNEPQTSLLRYVLEQPYSRDMVCNMLSLNKQVKQRCTVLEDQLVDLIVLAMERSEGEEVNAEDGESQFLWQHLSSQLIFFVLFQFASFPDMVLALYKKLKGRNLRKGRDHLMWVLLQFISGSIQKNPLGDFLPVMKLYDLLYTEKEPIVVPDYNKAVSTHSMAVTCIWIHLNKKAQNDCVKLHRPIPHALHKHLEFLKISLATKNLPMTDYRIALLCNAYSTNNEYFSLPMGILVESIYGNTTQGSTMLPNNIQASAPISPLRMSLLDSLTVHAKMSLIHSIVTRVMRLAQSKTCMALALAPALVETYSRLLVYMEIESLGIKGFITQLLPSVFKSNAWGILHTLLEMFSYRLHHIQPHYRMQLLSNLHTLASVPQTNQNQLHICSVESTALRLIMGLGSSEVYPQLSRNINEPKTMVVSTESEELNRALVLTLARAMHVTGSESTNWCREILNQIMQYTPHSWSSHTLSCFPPALGEFFNQNPVNKVDKDSLKRSVDAEYRKWKSMIGENDLIAHFSMQGTPTLFLCVLWRSLLEDDRISPTAYKVLERLGPRILSNHLRTFAEYLVNEFSNSGGGQQVNKFVEKLNDMIWKCHVVTVDRLVLCLALRSLEGSEAHVCFFIIQLLLLKPSEFRVRVQEFVRDNSPSHWEENNWHEKHMAFHRKFPEKFYYEGLQDVNTQSNFQYLPIYFGNVCLRFLPVFDIVIHRFLELPNVAKNLESLLDHLGTLYKFHDRPMTFLYNTLHYYERNLKERPALKKKLVSVIIGSLKDIRPANWCLSEDYCQYLGWNQEEAEQQRAAEDTSWQPQQEYYIRLMNRLVDTIGGKIPLPFPNFDWRFNEFPNPSAHALYATCIELMALPVSSSVVGSALLDIILKGATQIPRDKIMAWMNAVGLVLTSLPDSYWQVLNERIIETLKSPHLATPGVTNPFQAFNFSVNHHVVGEMYSSYVLALCHAVWQHASIGQLSMLPVLLRDHLKPVVKTEEQYILVCHLVGPFLQRFHAERTRCLLDLTVELYEMLEQVDSKAEHLSNIDPIADFLYHIKYMYVGDGVKQEVEKVIRNLRQSLQMRLRFISHHGREESTSA